MRYSTSWSCLGFGLVIAAAAPLYAAPIAASDDANNAVYDDGWDLSDDGGVEFDSWVELNGGGGRFLETGGRQVTGTRSFGIFSGSSRYDIARPLERAAVDGTYTVFARFDVNNNAGESGFSLKTAAGSAFNDSNAILRFGLIGNSLNDTIVVNGGTETLDVSGADNSVTGDTIRFDLTFDTAAGTYSLTGQNFDDGVTNTVSGSLVGSGPVSFLGFGNANTGGGQNLIFDGLAMSATAVPEPLSAGAAGLLGLIALRRRR